MVDHISGISQTMGAYRSSLVSGCRSVAARSADAGTWFMCMEERNIDLDCLFRIMAYHSLLLVVKIPDRFLRGAAIYMVV